MRRVWSKADLSTFVWREEREMLEVCESGQPQGPGLDKTCCKLLKEVFV
jgi:hypothetical protein